ncbi:MAG: hypothetical protein JWP88_1493 [Flaviaesturariibacter sp.]|nr:hypothetical protein [Flaviaesturariibacter sp.]
MQTILQQFIEGMKQTTPLEYIAVVTGIVSVWFSKKENILVYPVGLINTGIYTYLSLSGELYGEASVNVYYTIMSIWGWIIWARKNDQQQHVLQISFSTPKQWIGEIAFFAAFYIAIYFSLTYLKQEFSANTIPGADAFASATAFTGMWLMARKKVESWYWWVATNVTSIPLYFVKGYVFTSVLFFVLLVLAFFGLAEWKGKARKAMDAAQFKFETP